MSNKNTTNNTIKNNVFTPNQVKLGLTNIPSNYILKVQSILDRKIQEGFIEKNYSKNYISRVKLGELFNEDIIEALVEVGLEHHSKMKQFLFKNKKNPSTN